MNPIQIVFDGPPDHNAPRFVEVERGGKCLRLGEWKELEDGLWVIEIAEEIIAQYFVGMCVESLNPALFDFVATRILPILEVSRGLRMGAEIDD